MGVLMNLTPTNGDGANLAFLLGNNADLDHLGTPLIYVNDWQGLQMQSSASRTNLCLQSQTLSAASWLAGLTNIASRTDDQTADPSGTTHGAAITETTDGGAVTHQFGQNVTVANTSPYTYSVWLKASARSSVQVRLSGAGTYASAVFNLATGAITNVTGTAAIVGYPNGWWRCTVSGTTDSTTCTILHFLKSGGSDYQGNGSLAIYMFGAQLEAGGVMTSYLVTVAAANTRTDYSITGGTVTFAAAPTGGGIVQGNYSTLDRN